ncbi:MAG: AAA family ATPase, partial [Bryobacteraceae bacterium]
MLRGIFDSGRPLVYVQSAEEDRIGRVLREIGIPVFTWSLTEGLEGEVQSPRAVLDHIGDHSGAAIFHLKDFHEPLRESPEIRRRLRDLDQSCLNQRKFVVITSPVRSIPEELERNLLFVQLRPPDLNELVAFLKDESQETDEAILNPLARAVQGLTLEETRYALRRALAATPRLGPESIPALLEEKRFLVNRSGVVEYIADGTQLGDVGGLEGLKKWLLERQKLFHLRDTLSAEL